MNYSLRDNLISAGIGVAIGLPLSLYAVSHQHPDPIIIQPKHETVIIETVTPEPIVHEMTEEDIAEEAYYDSLELLAALVHAEAGNQDLTGKRLVADVVFNRVDSEDFPDTIEAVIYQKNQFSPVSDGALEDAFYTITEEDYEAVRLEMNERLDYDILYFTSEGYIKCGTPAYQHGDHYFNTK